jgi:Ca2+-binding EF-hand superfamily protein
MKEFKKLPCKVITAMMKHKMEMKTNKDMQKKMKETKKKMFEEADVNKDGKLDLNEFKEMMKCMKEMMKKKFGETMNCPPEVVENVFKSFDRSGTGLLSMEDCCEGMKRREHYCGCLMMKMMQWNSMMARCMHMKDESVKKMMEFKGWGPDMS